MTDTMRATAFTMTFLLLAGPMLQPMPVADAAPSSHVGSVLRSAAEERPNEVALGLLTLKEEMDPSELKTEAVADVHVARTYEDFGVVVVRGANADLVDLADFASVDAVTANNEVEWTSWTEAVATRARTIWSNMSSHDPVHLGGERVTGDGVGVAVIDSGVDASHPDLRENVELNQEFVCPTPGLVNPDTLRCAGWSAVDEGAGAPVELDGCSDLPWREAINTDDGGHGTHVAGTIAGDGTASDGRWTGVAPNASIYGLGVGNSEAQFSILEALQWVNCNHDRVSPSIEILSMSLASRPAEAITEAMKHLVTEENVTLVVAAGNAGCCGTMNPLSELPTPGLLSVANYDDDELGRRDGGIHPTSSRCAISAPAYTCPDVAAPGTSITATRSSVSDGVLLTNAPYYETRTGTSMSTPHMSGVIALLLQANPSLDPADIEDVLEDTARSIGDDPTVEDPTNEGNVSIAAGHGLVDALAALEDPRVLGDGLGAVEPLPQLDGQAHVYQWGLVDGQLTPGAPPTLDAKWTVTAGMEHRLAERGIQTGNESTWPLSTALDCRFLVSHEGTDKPVGVPCEEGIQEDAQLAGFQMSASYSFPEPGEYTVEVQIEFPDQGYESFDRFDLTAR